MKKNPHKNTFVRRVIISSLIGLLPLGQQGLIAASSQDLWDVFIKTPETHPQIPDCSYAGYARSEKPLPTPAVVVNVKDSGAVGDGKTNDTEAFVKAMASAKEKGGGAVLVPSGTYRIEGFLHLQHDGVILRGEGPGKTILDFPKSLTQSLHPFPQSDKSGWSWSGGVIWIGPSDTFDANGLVGKDQPAIGQHPLEYWHPGEELASVLSAPAGSKTLEFNTGAKLNTPSQLGPGSLVILRYDNPADLSFLKHIAGHPTMDSYNWVSADWITQPVMPYFYWPVEIASVENNKIRLAQPLRVEIRPEWGVKVMSVGPVIREAGIEHLTILNHAPAEHKHLTNQGHNGIYINRAYNCFVRDVEVRSSENGINVAASKNVTVSEVTFTGPEQQHHTLACRVMSADVLFEKFTVDGPKRVKHGINTEWFSSGNVWRKGVMKKGVFDSHRALSFDSIRTDIEMNNDADGPGGAGGAGPFLGRRVVHWNIRVINSPRKDPGEFVFMPDANPMGALVGIQGVPVSNGIAPGMPKGDKGCIIADEGKAPTPPDLFEAQLQLRLKSKTVP